MPASSVAPDERGKRNCALAPRTYDEMGYPPGAGYHPGDWELFSTPHAPGIASQWDAAKRHCDWDNCSGHFLLVLPCGHNWGGGRRASNCTLPFEKTHRCWVLIGQLPKLTLNKAGPTCDAGRGSIICGGCGWHGHLNSGVFTEC